MKKITKFLSLLSFFGALALTAHADGDYMHAKKAHHAKTKAVEYNAPVHTEAPQFEQSPMSMKKGGLSSGMTFGIGGNYGFAINSNSDFVVPDIAAGAAAGAAPAFAGTTFNQKHDSLYGGFVSLGWMMENGLGADVRVGYDQLKLKNKDNAKDSLESDIISATLNVTYYLDLFEGLFLPYVSIGGGLARINTKGTLYDNAAAPVALAFKDLKKTYFKYEASAGVSTSFDSVILGLEYKFSGVPSFSDVSSDVSVTANNIKVTNPFSYGSYKFNTHNVSASIKFVV